MLRVVALWVVSSRVIVVMLSAALAAYSAQRKNRCYEDEDDDAPDRFHLQLPFLF